MPRQMTRSEREAFLAEPRVAVLSVAGADGPPAALHADVLRVPPGGEITFFTNTERRTATQGRADRGRRRR